MKGDNADIDWYLTRAAIWRARKQHLRPVTHLDSVQLDDLLGVDRQKTQLTHNIERFLRGEPSNHVLLWGARGTGKSSLVKALLNRYGDEGLRVIEIDQQDLCDMADIVDSIRDLPQRFLLYCDDLSFADSDASYKALKRLMEGSIELPPDNVRLVATSNRRHLLPEYMNDNLQARHQGGEVHQGDAVEEKISLADRFGLCLSFYPFSQDDYLALIDQLFADYPENRAQLHREALRFALAKGARNGRAAQQFFNHWVG